jgi:hypothetical protein
MVKSTRPFLADALKRRITEVGGNEELAKERIIADMDAHRLEVTWEDRHGAACTNVLPAGCTAWAKAYIDWSQSTARWRYGQRAFCIRVRPAQELPTTAVAETRCREWLNKLMRASQERCSKSKSEYRTEAQTKFGVSGKGFNRAWTDGIKTTGAT